MEREFITVVPAYGTTEATATYRGLMPLLGTDMADEQPSVVGVSLVRGHFTTWLELHRRVFGVDPASMLMPRKTVANEDLYSRWEGWHEEVMRELGEGATEADLERVVSWGGVAPFKVTASACHGCAKPGFIVPVIGPLCWPVEASPNDPRRPWDYQFPAEHLRREVALVHERYYNDWRKCADQVWQDMLDSGWTSAGQGVESEDLDSLDFKAWTIDDLTEYGFDDEINTIEEQADEMVVTIAGRKHADAMYIQGRVLREWLRLLDGQCAAQVTRNHHYAKNLTYVTAMGLNEWRATSDR